MEASFSVEPCPETLGCCSVVAASYANGLEMEVLGFYLVIVAARPDERRARNVQW